MKVRSDLKEFRSKGVKELTQELKKQYKKLRELRFAAEFRKNKDLKSIRKTRQIIARLWTVLGEKMEKESKRSE